MIKFNKSQAKENEVPTVGDKEIDSELDKLAQSRTKTETVERAAKDGDVAVIDFVVTVDNVPIEGGTSKAHPLVLGSGAFIPGFEEEVIGMTAGEQKTIKLSFPAEYHAKHLAGKSAKFAVTMIRVEKRIVPEIDDAFAQSLGEQFKSLDDIKKNLREGMQHELEGKQQEQQRSAVAEELEKFATVAIPDVLIQQELSKMESRFGEQLSQSGMTLDDMLAKMDKTKDALLDEWRPQAVKRVTIGLALDQIFADMELTVPQEKIQAQINTMLTQYGGLEEAQKQVDVAALYGYVKNSLQQEEVLEYLENLGMTKEEDK
jgi:trigger factor